MPNNHSKYRTVRLLVRSGTPVKLEREFKDGWIVRDGLNDGDKIIVDGVMRVRPGAPVRPAPIEAKDKTDTTKQG